MVSYFVAFFFVELENLRHGSQINRPYFFFFWSDDFYDHAEASYSAASVNIFVDSYVVPTGKLISFRLFDFVDQEIDLTGTSTIIYFFS